MRVVHVARYFHPHRGGTEQVIASLARELAAEGVESTVVVSDLDRSGTGPTPEVPVVEVPVVGPARFPIPRGRLGEVVRILRGADIVHLHDVRFLFEATALVRRGPVVVTTHGLVFHTDAGARAKAIAWRGWIAPRLRRVDRVDAVSARDAELGRAAGIDRVVTIPNGVDVDGFLAVPDRRREAPVAHLLYFGRVAPEKDVGALAAVLRARPSWRVTVAGPGDGADLFVFPSFFEAMPVPPIEAMAAGVPVVASNLGALPEMVGAERCVPPNDPAALAARMTALWEDAELRRAEGDLLIARARAHHSESDYVARLLELYAPGV